MTAISKTHQYNGCEFSRKDPAIKRTLMGIRRTLSKEQPHRVLEDRKSPVLLADIREMAAALSDTLSGKRDRAILLLGFAAALRRSELANIHKEHLTFVKEGIILLLPWSKAGMREIPIPYGRNFATCPVRSLQKWISAAQIESGSVFRPINRHLQIQPTPRLF